MSFGIGLDSGTGGTDDVQLLTREQHKVRWQQYSNGAPAFDCPEPEFWIDGTG